MPRHPGSDGGWVAVGVVCPTWLLRCTIPGHHFSVQPLKQARHPFFGHALAPIPQPAPGLAHASLASESRSTLPLQPTGDFLSVCFSLSLAFAPWLLPPPRQDVAVWLRAQVPTALCSNLAPL